MEDDKNDLEKQYADYEKKQNRGSHKDNVSPFGFLHKYQNNVFKETKSSETPEDIKARIEESKARNLNASSASDRRVEVEEPDSIPTPSANDYEEPSIPNYNEEDDNSTLSTMGNTASNVANAGANGKKLYDKINNAGNAQKVGETLKNGSEGLAKGGEALSKGAELGANAIKAGGEAAGKAVVAGAKAIGSGISSAVAAVAAFFGVSAGVLIVVLMLIIFLIILLYLIVSGLGIKSGTPGIEVYENFNDEYYENITSAEIENIIDSNHCELGIIDSLLNFFGIYDLSDPCQFQKYVKQLIDEKEYETDIDPIPPGYLFATLYYSFDTQNYDENGEMYIPVPRYSDDEARDGIEEEHLYTDIEAITALFEKVKKHGTTSEQKIYEVFEDVKGNIINSVYSKPDVSYLLDSYIYKENHELWPYFKLEFIVDDTMESGGYYTCAQKTPINYYLDELKFKLNLRYGKDVMEQYEEDRTIEASWKKTDGPFDLPEGAEYDNTVRPSEKPGGAFDCHPYYTEVTKIKEEDLPDLSIYNKKANPNVPGDDNAVVTLLEKWYVEHAGETYTYEDGFAYHRFPRYDNGGKRFILEGEWQPFTYNTAKDIEKIIETIDSKQNYYNYVLGYPNTIDVAYGTNGRNPSGGGGSYTSPNGAVCKYTVKGQNINGLKVQLTHVKTSQNDSIPGITERVPIAGQDPISFEQYILGVVYAEIGGSRNEEALKAQAIAAASYTLAGVESGRFKINNGVISISNSTFDQTYCDPDKGCYACFDSEHKNNITLLTPDTVPAGATCRPHFGPLASDSVIRKAVSEVVGMFLVNDKNEIYGAGYVGSDQTNWNNWASQGLDYIEILRKQYGNYTITEPDCTFSPSVTGEWANWKQYDTRWKDIWLGTTQNPNRSCPPTSGCIGCLATAYSIVIAKSAPNIAINPFNPGTFFNTLKQNGLFGKYGDLKDSEAAIRLAVGPGVSFTKSSHSITGSKESKETMILNYLKQGYDVILGVKNGGHYVVITGMSADGKLTMADPGSSQTVVENRYDSSGWSSISVIKFN